MVKCKNIVNILNNLYNKKLLLNKNCLDGKHKYTVDKIKLKLPNMRLITLNIEKNDNIYNPLSFVLSHINKKDFKHKEENKNAFTALLLILAILEDYRIVTNYKNDRLLTDKSIIDKITPFIQLDTYKIIIPNKIKYIFKVTANDLAIMKCSKLKK